MILVLILFLTVKSQNPLHRRLGKHMFKWLYALEVMMLSIELIELLWALSVYKHRPVAISHSFPGQNLEDTP